MLRAEGILGHSIYFIVRVRATCQSMSCIEIAFTTTRIIWNLSIVLVSSFVKRTHLACGGAGYSKLARAFLAISLLLFATLLGGVMHNLDLHSLSVYTCHLSIVKTVNLGSIWFYIWQHLGAFLMYGQGNVFSIIRRGSWMTNERTLRLRR